MKATFGLAVRGDGTAYVKVVFTDLPAASTHALQAEVSLDNGTIAPCALVPTSIENTYVLTLPLMNTAKWAVRFICRDDSENETCTRKYILSVAALKWKSRLNYRTRPTLARSIRNADSRLPQYYSARFLRVVPDGEELVVHVCIKGPEKGFNKVQWFTLTLLGEPCTLNARVLENGHDVAEDGTSLHFKILSFRIPKSIQGFCIKASASQGSEIIDGFGVLDEQSSHAMQKEYLTQTLSAAQDPTYNAWFKKHAATPSQLKKQAETTMSSMPCFSIVVPLYNTPKTFLEEMLKSVIGQSYKNWQLVLVNASPQNEVMKQQLSSMNDNRVIVVDVQQNLGIVGNTNKGIASATGDFICFLDHDDILAPNALFEYAQAVSREPTTDILYCDEDRFDSRGHHSVPFFKPDYSPHLLRVHNYITHFLAIRASVIEQVGLADSVYEGAQDYDLTLRASEIARAVTHVPQVLYHWRLHEGSTSTNSESKIDYAKEAGRLAVLHHLERKGIAATVHNTSLPFAYKVEYELPHPQPSVSIIIPNKDHIDILDTCIQSLLEKCTYKNYEIVIVENNSIEVETQRYYANIQAQDSRVKVIVWEDEFNFSRIVNFGAEFAQGEYLLLLNNDTQVIAPDFLQSMVGLANQPDVGVVGSKLLYSDGLIQHAGVRVGPHGGASHLFVNMPADEPGYFDHVRFTQDLSAVTGACQMVRRSVWEQLNGYCDQFTVGYNDVDFCLRARGAGYYVVYEPSALLYHHEFASRERDVKPERQERVKQETELLQSRWPDFFSQGDSFSNPNFAVNSVYCALGD